MTEIANGTPNAGTKALVVRDLSCSFGETKALVHAQLEVGWGEIHSLAGENGSGKSTLIKIMSGVLRAHAGTISWDGEPRTIASPRAAQSAGISTVFQETLVAPELSVRDNVFIGTDGVFRHGQRASTEVERTREACRAIGLANIDIERPVWTLSLAERQLVTIARAIVRPWRLLILDEGTSALDANQRDRLFAYLRAARDEGKSVLFTSHRMDEVFELAERITVLRAGSTVASFAASETTERAVLEQMSGRERAAGRPSADADAPVRLRSERAAGTAMRTNGLVVRRDAPPIDIELRLGEILGIAGLEGQGQVEFVEALCGLRRPLAGSVSVFEGATEHVVHSYVDATRRGVLYVPRDRRHEGLFAPLSVFDNFAIALWSELNRFGILRKGEAKRRFREYASSSRLVARSSGQSIATLSGGNQQKVLLGRWISMNPRVLVLNDPLRGVDANTKEELYGFFRSLAEQGIAMVYLSTEIHELLSLADRIAVFHEGTQAAMVPVEATSETDIVAAMFGERIEAREHG